MAPGLRRDSGEKPREIMFWSRVVMVSSVRRHEEHPTSNIQHPTFNIQVKTLPPALSRVQEREENASCEDAVYEVAVDVGEAEVSALEAVGEFGVVEAQEVEEGGV